MDERIRVLGTEGIEAVVAAKGDLVSFTRFRKQQPRGRFVHVQLLAAAVAPERVPCPLTGVLVTVDGG